MSYLHIRDTKGETVEVTQLGIQVTQDNMETQSTISQDGLSYSRLLTCDLVSTASKGYFLIRMLQSFPHCSACGYVRCTDARAVNFSRDDHHDENHQKSSFIMSIDPTDFVQVEGDQDSLKFGDPRQQAKFELGVCMAVYKWEELTTAVDNSWGGPNSADKRDWILGLVIDLFNEKAVDLVLIEETMLYAMVDEFDTEIDNDSALTISDLVLKIYRECAMQNYARVDELYARFQMKQQSGVRSGRVVVGQDPNNPSDSSDDEEDTEQQQEQIPTLVEDDGMDIDQGPRQPIIDEDGFELVQRRGRRR